MPDITMCSNEHCPQRGTCYRATATPSDMLQSYALYIPKERGKCEHYWEARSSYARRLLDLQLD